MRSPRSGFTLIELTIVVGLLSVTFWILAGTLRSANGAFRAGTETMEVETSGSRAMRRIVDALRGADATSIAALPSPPFSSASIDFQVVENYDGQATPLGPPSRIDFDLFSSAVRWTENAGLPDSSSANWVSGVTELLEGETLNGLDDNGNGLVDEPGLCFSRTGALVTVQLTLSVPRAEGTDVTRTWTNRVLCRN